MMFENKNNLSLKQFFQENVYSKSRSFGSEMKNLQELMKTDPVRGKELLGKGYELITLAQNGNYFKYSLYLANLVNEFESNQLFPFIYFLHKSLETSLQSLHFMISSFVIDNGYPLSSTEMPNLLITCIKNPELCDDECGEVIKFLKMKNFDFNLQVSPLFISLHPFCTRLVLTIFILFWHLSGRENILLAVALRNSATVSSVCRATN